MSASLFQGARLAVEVLLSRAITHVEGPTAIDILLDIRPVTANPHAPPVDLRLVLDRSGSMRDAASHTGVSKLETVKQAVHRLIDELNPCDRLMILSFDSQPRVEFQATLMHESAKTSAHLAVDEIHVGGETLIHEALGMAVMTPTFPGHQTRVVLLTDGMSSYPDRDHPFLTEIVDQFVRPRGLCLDIYGTGDSYEHGLLTQLAVCAGNGSAFKHILEVDELREHLRGELAFMRGVAVEGLVVRGSCANGANIVNVTRFMPDMRELLPHGLPTPVPNPSFSDHSGSLDTHRGQQYLISLIVDATFEGVRELMNLQFNGRTATEQTPVQESFMVTGVFTHDANDATSVNERIRSVLLQITGARLAAQEKYEQAEKLYEQAGDMATSTRMRALQAKREAGTHTGQELSRTLGTLTGRSISVAFTRTGGDAP